MTNPISEVPFEYEGESFTLVFDMKAIAFFEREMQVSMLDALQGLEAAKASGRAPMISHLAGLVQAGLHRHHQGVDLDMAMAMAVSPEVQSALGTGVASAMPVAKPGEDVPGEVGNGPAPSTGTKPSKARSKRG